MLLGLFYQITTIFVFMGQHVARNETIDHILQHNVLTCEKYYNKQLKQFSSLYLQPHNDETH